MAEPLLTRINLLIRDFNFWHEYKIFFYTRTERSTNKLKFNDLNDTLFNTNPKIVYDDYFSKNTIIQFLMSSALEDCIYKEIKNDELSHNIIN